MSFWFWFWFWIAVGVAIALYGAYLEESEKSKNKENLDDLNEKFASLQDSLNKLKKLSAKQNKIKSPEPKYEENKYDIYLKQATQLKKKDINKAIDCIKKALDEVQSESISNKVTAIEKLASYIQLSGNAFEALQVLNTNYKKVIDEKENYFMRTMTASILVGQMGVIFRKEKKENIVLSYQSTCLHIIALACQGRWSRDDQLEYLGNYTKRKDYNKKLNEFLHNNSKSLIMFNRIGLMFFEIDGDNKARKYWSSDQQINKIYDNMITEIGDTIEEELLKFKSS
tara:strand:+ start:578 stop:1429 length:852 start_codon:yes stop_codon:yes gene_type:complete